MKIKGTVPHVLLLFVIITIIVTGKGLKGISITLMEEWLYSASRSIILYYVWMQDAALMLTGSLCVFIGADSQAFINFSSA